MMCLNRLLTSPTHSVKSYLYFVIIISKKLQKSSTIQNNFITLFLVIIAIIVRHLL